MHWLRAYSCYQLSRFRSCLRCLRQLLVSSQVSSLEEQVPVGALEPLPSEFPPNAMADGNLKLGPEIECLPRADARSAAVAAASVVAKVLRDGAMRTLATEHSGYGFDRHVGYGTPGHRLALAELGPCRVHRLSYAGVGT